MIGEGVGILAGGWFTYGVQYLESISFVYGEYDGGGSEVHVLGLHHSFVRRPSAWISFSFVHHGSSGVVARRHFHFLLLLCLAWIESIPGMKTAFSSSFFFFNITTFL